jgi:hypothetical protein
LDVAAMELIWVLMAVHVMAALSSEILGTKLHVLLV